MDLFIIAGSIVSLGFLFFLFLIFKKANKHIAIKHYEKLRDELSVRDAEEKTGITEEEYQEYSGGFLSNIIGGLITILIGTQLLPIIMEELNSGIASGEISGVSAKIIYLVPIFFIISLIVTAFSIFINAFRRAGLF